MYCFTKHLIMAKAYILAVAAVFLGIIRAEPQHDPHYWNNRNTIVHLFEWKWNDIADECERFLAPRGFAGVQVSPANENAVLSNIGMWWVQPPGEKVIVTNRPWWERYQPISYKLVTRSGNETEFADMVRRCNNVGIRIYVDVVLNHMAGYLYKAVGTGGSLADLKALSYPAVHFDNVDFHRRCNIDNYSDPFQMRNCQLPDVNDLDQSTDRVRAILVEFLDHLVELGVSGFRIDAATHMHPDDLAVIYARVKNLNTAHGFPPKSRPFIFQEVIDYGSEAISKYDYIQFGAVTECMFSVEIRRAFSGENKLKWLRTWGRQWGFLPSESAVVYVDSHVSQRSADVLTYKTPKLYKMATAFALAYPYGNSRIMSSYSFNGKDDPPPAHDDETLKSPEFDSNGACTNGWVCEHRWRQIYNMIEFKNVVKNTDITDWWDNHSNQIAFCRGKLGFIAFNGDKYDLKQNLQTCLPAGIYCDVISGTKNGSQCSGKIVTVGLNGMTDIEIGPNELDGVLAIHEKSRITLFEI